MKHFSGNTIMPVSILPCIKVGCHSPAARNRSDCVGQTQNAGDIWVSSRFCIVANARDIQS